MNDSDFFSLLRLWVYTPFASAIASVIAYFHWVNKKLRADLEKLEQEADDTRIEQARQDERIKNLEKKS